MNAHQKKAARFTATAFGVIILAISASTSFAFFYNYFSNLIPPGVMGPDVAALISGIVGTLLFDVAAVVWLQTYLNDARTPEQRAISLMMLIVTFVGAAAASVAHLSLSATGDLALDAATLDSIATVSLVTVIIGVISNFGSTIAYQRFSYDNKQSVRTSDREDEIQKAEDEAANELDSLVSQKLKERLTHIAPNLADQQAERIAAQYERRESAKYGSAETAALTPRHQPRKLRYELFHNGKRMGSGVSIETLKEMADEGPVGGYHEIVDTTNDEVVWSWGTRPTHAPTGANGRSGAGYNYPYPKR